MAIEARRALARLAPFADSGATTIRPAAGLSGRAFRVDYSRGAFALRLAGDGLAVEAAAARAAAAAGLGPRVVAAGAGALVVDWLDDAAPLGARALTEPGTRRRAAAALRALHRLSPPIARRLPLAEALVRLRRRAALAIDRRGFAAALAAAEAVGRGESFCHGDAVTANLLDDGARVRLVDFAYAGRGDPLWDVAYLAADAGLDAVAEAALHTAWLGRPRGAAERARLDRFRALAHLVMALWAATEMAPGAPRRGTIARHLAGFVRVTERLPIR